MTPSSTRIYIVLIFVLAALTALNVYTNPLVLSETDALPVPLIVLALVNAAVMIVVYGGLGWFGLKLADKLGFAPIWPSQLLNIQTRLVIPAIAGMAVGVLLIALDLIFRGINGFGPGIHPPFPLSLVASGTAGIGEEVIFRALLVPVFMWLLLRIKPLKSRMNLAFWIAAIISGLLFALGHIPSVMMLGGIQAVSAISPILIVQIILMNGVLALVAAHYFRTSGFLAAVSVHFWTDIVWHVIWGLFT